MLEHLLLAAQHYTSLDWGSAAALITVAGPLAMLMGERVAVASLVLPRSEYAILCVALRCVRVKDQGA